MKTMITTLLIALMTLSAFGQRLNDERPPRGGQYAIGSSMHGGGPPRGGMSGMHGNKGAMLGRALQNPEIAEAIGLTEEQQDAIAEQMMDLQEKHIDLKAELEKSALQQARLMMDESVDQAVLMEAVEETGRIRTALAKLKIEHLLFVRETLTPEQIDQIKERIHDRMHQRRRQKDQDGKYDSTRRRGSRSEDRPRRGGKK